MPVRIVQGDLLQAPEDMIGHQVNCRAVMGSGVAKQIKHRYPQVYQEYVQFCRENKENLLGQCQIVGVSTAPAKYVANLFGQYDYGRDGRKYTDDGALRNALEQLYTFTKTNGCTVAFPYKIGCDRGGGDWNAVCHMIEHIFHDIEVVLYKLE